MDPDDALRAFHERTPGTTAAAYARGRDEHGRSSYALLEELVTPGERVLDLGCGDGYLVQRLHQRGENAMGVDVARGELAAARRRGVTGVCADAVRLPLASASFDVVLSHLAFHVMARPQRVVEEVARVLTPRGRFAAIVGGGPVATPPGSERDGFGVFASALGRVLAGRPRHRFGVAAAQREEGWRAWWEPLGFRVSWSRHEIDLSGDLGAVWTTLSSAYDVALLDDTERASVAEEIAALAAPGNGHIPLRMVVWRGIATR